MQKTLMEMLIEAGYPKEEMDHYCSDLYVYVTPLTTKVIEEWCNTCTGWCRSINKGYIAEKCDEISR